ncbi:MAG TPA: T9SS type A sorting domain-containing protein, partial [Bacteroidia bacterium]|nr:T9SS type A sorting domain-containing protein [Bacteroidia bacterium]
AELYQPTGVTVDTIGNVYIADGSNNRIRKIGINGKISTVAGNGAGGFSGDGGQATAAELNDPAAIAVDKKGNIYIADYYNDCIRQVNSSGVINTIAGNGSFGFSGDGGQATNAELNSPTGVAVDNSGNVYIVDANDRIRKVNTAGIINTIAGNGNTGFSGDGGQATAAEFNFPQGLSVDTAGNIYIADAGNNRVRKINALGVIATIAGNGTAGALGNKGQATAAELNAPTGVQTDKMGNVYIADWKNNCIRKISDSGIITTVAGNDSIGFYGDGGPSTVAELNAPYAIALDTTGNLYIADVNNNRIREVTTPWLEKVQELIINNEELGIYPNPNKGIFTLGVKSEELRTKGTVEAYNMLGEKVYSNSFSTFHSQFSINLSAQPNGIYLVKVQTEDGNILTQKIEITK